MEDSKTYRMPKDFNPYTSLDALRGLADAIHHALLEGPGTQARIPYPDKAAMNGLVELLRVQTHAVHDYFSELENRTLLDLPMSQEEIDAQDLKYTKADSVEEERALYLVS